MTAPTTPANTRATPRSAGGGSSSRRPGRPRVLSEAEIVDAALALARERGIARLSMRAVARHLQVPPMTIYGYVPNKEALDALVIDRILSEVRVPEPSEGTWESRLAVMLCDARRILVERPQLAEGGTEIGSAVELLHRGAFGREASRLTDAVFDLMREGGFHADDLEVCFGALFTYVTGLLDPGGADLTAAQSPSTDRSTRVRTSAEIFALGLEALIEGLKLTMRTESSRAAPT